MSDSPSGAIPPKAKSCLRILVAITVKAVRAPLSAENAMNFEDCIVFINR
jgi:hypothetical protein